MKQSLSEQFVMSFVTNDRWKLYLRGLGQSLLITIGALVIGIIIGILIAIVRTAHDQAGNKKTNPLLSIANGICYIYTTIIRGTPMYVQLLIMGFVIFQSSRNLVGIA